MSNAYAAEPAPDRQEALAQAEPALILEDEDFIRIVRSERMNAIGMADAPHGGEDIIEDRERALEYYKGQMDDVPALPNRSKVTTTEVRDAILTVIPDIVEIFLSGDEIGTFEPVGPEDEEAAKQETAVVNHVIFGQNDAFTLIYDAVHDALVAKYAVIHFYAETDEAEETEHFEAATALELEAAFESGDVTALDELAQEPGGPLEEPLYTFMLTRKKRTATIVTEAVAPEDFGLSRDDGKTYRVMRSRQRRQDLIEQGHDRELVMSLPVDPDVASEEIDLARDLAGEHEEEATSGAGIPEMQEVVVHVHNVRVDADGDGRTEIWRVVTDENDGVLLEKQKVPCFEFAGGSPVRQPHRPYGFSLADLLIDVQRIKTALTRMLLDMGYFAVNARHAINVERAAESTIQDYLDNAPGRPVLTRGDNVVTPISPGSPGFNPFDALEYFSTLGELRAGVMRASMGIDPDSLHETKGAALAMLSAAQRRVRFLARTLAETCFRELFVGVHTMLRTYGGSELRRRIKGQWVAADPSSWGTRDNMTVDIGSGLAGREYDMAVANNIRGMMTEIVTGQAGGAIKGEIVTADNIYNLARRTIERAGWKSPELYVTDPRQNPQGQGEQQEDPEAAKARAELQIEMTKAKQKAELDQFTAQQNARIKEEEARQSIDLKRIELANDMQLAREKATAEAELALYKTQLEADLAVRKSQFMDTVTLSKLSENRPGGRLDE